MNNLNDVFLDVALECYERVRSLQPGSEDAEATERAISMALLGNRHAKDKEHLLGDVIRNGRYSARRGRARRLQALEEARDLATRGITTGGSRGLAELETPESLCIARELRERLEAAAERCGPHGLRVLEGLIAGNTGPEIASETGVSLSTVNRVVRLIRTAAVDDDICRAAA